MPEIAVLAWGPTVRDPGGLILRDGVWHEDGPMLPIELCRVAGDRSVTLALCRGAGLVPTFWTYMGTDGVGEAVWSLAQREGAKPEEIGFLDLETGEHWFRTVDEHLDTLRDWAREKNRQGEKIDFIIWSDLKANFEKKARKEFNPENVISYLRGLRPEIKDRAREYLEKAPERTQTEVRAAVQDTWDSIW